MTSTFPNGSVGKLIVIKMSIVHVPPLPSFRCCPHLHVFCGRDRKLEQPEETHPGLNPGRPHCIKSDRDTFDGQHIVANQIYKDQTKHPACATFVTDHSCS